MPDGHDNFKGRVTAPEQQQVGRDGRTVRPHPQGERGGEGQATVTAQTAGDEGPSPAVGAANFQPKAGDGIPRLEIPTNALDMNISHCGIAKIKLTNYRCSR